MVAGLTVTVAVASVTVALVARGGGVPFHMLATPIVFWPRIRTPDDRSRRRLGLEHGWEEAGAGP